MTGREKGRVGEGGGASLPHVTTIGAQLRERLSIIACLYARRRRDECST